jgi:hypothetical protein
MIKTAGQYWASHSAHRLQSLRAGGPLSSLGQNGQGGLLPTAPGAGERRSYAVTARWRGAHRQPNGRGGKCRLG